MITESKVQVVEGSREKCRYRLQKEKIPKAQHLLLNNVMCLSGSREESE